MPVNRLRHILGFTVRGCRSWRRRPISRRRRTECTTVIYRTLSIDVWR